MPSVRLVLAIVVVVIAATMGGRASSDVASATNQPAFRATIAPISAEVRRGMTSWRPGCPVAIRQLRLLTLTHWGFDGRVQTGRLVVHRREAARVVRALRTIFAARFPIRRMQPVEAYGSDDDRSMAADNTSGFNCRRVPGSRSWSAHAYGLAVDINPLENPEIVRGRVLPPAGAAYVDRSRHARGMIHRGAAVVGAFAAIGWRWGGYWRSPKDYQHFSATGT
jgi:hypothetical protein